MHEMEVRPQVNKYQTCLADKWGEIHWNNPPTKPQSQGKYQTKTGKRQLFCGLLLIAVSKILVHFHKNMAFH